MISFVVAVARNGVIGREGGLPWHISSDLKRFKEMEAELSKLKRMYADLAMENHAMKDLIAKKL